MISAKIVEDSITPYDKGTRSGGQRLTTFLVTFHRIVLSEFNTHRVFSKSSSSSRAIPLRRRIDQVYHWPAMPVRWGRNRPGMQQGAPDFGWRAKVGRLVWRTAARSAALFAWVLLKLDFHKELGSWLLEPFLWQTTVVTSTEWSNFFNLRSHESARPEFRELALAMKSAYDLSKPTEVQRGGNWHLPFVRQSERHLPNRVKIAMSAARCARTSYMNHDLTVPTIAQDVNLYHRLMNDGHMSPLEHQATPQLFEDVWSGNFFGWNQFRKLVAGEENMLGAAKYQRDDREPDNYRVPDQFVASLASVGAP